MQKIQRLQTILLFLLLGLFFFALTVASSFASEVDPIVGDEISIKSDGTWKFSRIADFGWTVRAGSIRELWSLDAEAVSDGRKKS